MANDTRSIGEKLRDIDSGVQPANQERGMGQSSERNRGMNDVKDYVKDRDTGDEDKTRQSER